MKKFMAQKEQDELFHQFINWFPSENEIAVLTLYAYAELPLPLHLDTIFSLSDPTISENVDFTITQSIINGWTGIDYLAAGHKHVLVLQFASARPAILSRLRKFNGTFSPPETQLGLCNKKEFEFIRQRLLQKNKPL